MFRVFEMSACCSPAHHIVYSISSESQTMSGVRWFKLACLTLSFSFSGSSQQLQLSSVWTQHVAMSPELAAADKPANVFSQHQQISAAEQKSRMDLQMSTALHGTTAIAAHHLSLF